MASALDRQLNEYKSRPRDESGARRTKTSLIYDPKQASFIDIDTFYQIGFQGFSKLCAVDDRFSEFSGSIFSYSNLQIDPLFLTADENVSIFEKVEKILYLLSDYVMRNEAVQILEYLIQQFAVNRLRPAHLVLCVLPYLETSFFVRVLQTIPFKTLSHDFKFLKDFHSVAISKRPINRKVFRDMIEKRPDLIHWITKYAEFITEYHPHGTFASFISVLFTELALNSSNEIIIRSILDTCRSSLQSDNKSLAPNILMAVAALNEKKNLHENVLNKFAQLIYKAAATSNLFNDYFRSTFMAAVYFGNHSNSPITVNFIITLGRHINDVDEFSKKYTLKQFAENCAKVIASNCKNEDVLHSAIALLETDLFYDIPGFFLSELCKNYEKSELCENLIQSIANHYPTCLTKDIIDQLKEINVTIKPNQITPRNLISQLSNPKYSASLYSNPELPFDIASSQVITSLKSAKSSNNTEPIVPILEYFNQRATSELIKYLAESLLMDGTTFSLALNQALSQHGDGISPFLKNLPGSNVEILEHLSKCEELPDIHVLPFALSKAIYKNDVIEALQFLPISGVDFNRILEFIYQDSENDGISIENDERIAATILNVVYQVSQKNDLPEQAISLLLNFPDFRCVARILKNVKQISSIISVFERSKPNQVRLRANFLYYINAICQKVEDVATILPSLYISLLTPNLVDQATLTLRSIPLKNKDVKVVLTHILRQSQLFKTNEQSICSVFNSAASNPKSREFFDKLWNNIQTASGCAQFWRLTHDIGVIPMLQKFESENEIAEILPSVFEVFPDNKELQTWAYNSLRPPLLRAVIPYLPITDIDKVIPFVCSYPRYFSESFTKFFQSHQIDANILIPFLKEKQNKLLPNNADNTPPEQFKSNKLKSKYVITPSTLILELIPTSKNISNLDSIIPTLFSILKDHKSQNLIFPILNLCLNSSAEYMIQNFSIIIDSLSHSPVPHIHASALRLVQMLASRHPTAASKHTTALFSVLGSSTVFHDDTANLVKIKQLFSSVLPVLSKTNNIDPLLNYFAENLEQFSKERSSQLMIHAINVLGDDSYKVFNALLRHNLIEFALLLADQMKPEQMMTALIKLLQSSVNSVKFVLQITLPSLPSQLLQLFGLIKEQLDLEEFSSFMEQTFDNFSLQDFINVVITFLPDNIDIYSYVIKRIKSDQSSLFVQLLEPLSKELKQFHSLQTNLAILSEITPCLTSEQSPKLIPLIQLIIQSVNDGNYNVQHQVQALCFMATAIEKFNLTLFEAFPLVVLFAVSLYSTVVSEQLEAFVLSTTASVVLLLKTSVNCCLDKLPQLWSLLISPFVISNESLYNMVEDSLKMTTKTARIDELLPSFFACYKDHVSHPQSLILIYRALSNCLKFSDSLTVNSNHQRIIKFFIILFAIHFDDLETDLAVSDSAIYAFCVFLTQLDMAHLKYAIRTVIDWFNTMMSDNKENYLASRYLFARMMTKVTDGLEKTIDVFLEQVLQSTLQLLNDNDDSDKMKSNIAAECFSLFQNIGRYAPDNLFNAEYFNQSLNAIIAHVTPVKQNETEEYITMIVGSIAPAFASLLDVTKDDSLWRAANQKLIDLMRDSDYRVRIAGLQMAEKAFSVVGPELTTILPELAPTLYELTEDSQNGVDQVARSTMKNIESSIGEEIGEYFK